MVYLEAVKQDKEITEVPLVLDLAERYLKDCGSKLWKQRQLNKVLG